MAENKKSKKIERAQRNKAAGKTQGAVRKHVKSKAIASGSVPRTDSSVGHMKRLNHEEWLRRQNKKNWNIEFFTRQSVLASETDEVLALAGTSMAAAAKFLALYADMEVGKTDEKGRRQKRCTVIAEKVRLSFPPIQRRHEAKAINRGISTAIGAITDSYDAACSQRGKLSRAS